MADALFSKELVSSNRIIYTPSEFARTSLIYLQETGTLQAKYPHTSKRNGLDSYLFFMVLSGLGELQYNDSTYKLKQNDCVFIDCKYPYAHTTSNNLWQLKWVHFNGQSMSEIYNKYISRGGEPIFTMEQPEQCVQMLDDIFTIASSDDYIRDMKINEKLYLTKIFKEQYGTTINAYISQKRITAAKQLLRFSDKTIEQVSAEIGINDTNYFTRLFKKIEGITPGEYRKQW